MTTYSFRYPDSCVLSLLFSKQARDNACVCRGIFGRACTQVTHPPCILSQDACLRSRLETEIKATRLGRQAFLRASSPGNMSASTLVVYGVCGGCLAAVCEVGLVAPPKILTHWIHSLRIPLYSPIYLQRYGRQASRSTTTENKYTTRGVAAPR